MDRRIERMAWTLTFSAIGCIYLLVMLVSFFTQNFVNQLIALCAANKITGLADRRSPWDHPTTPLWKLFLPPASLTLVTAYGLLRCEGYEARYCLERLAIVSLVILLLLLVVGSSTWEDGERPVEMWDWDLDCWHWMDEEPLEEGIEWLEIQGTP